MVRRKIQNITRFDVFSTHIIPATIVFIMMMVLIGFSWRTAARTVTDTKNEEVRERANIIETQLKERMALYENSLRAASGLYESSTFVERHEWEHFVGQLDINDRLPGMLGIGFVDLLTASQVPAYVERIRNEGFSDFTIRPEEPARDLYSSITYIEPMNERNRRVIGGDMLTEEKRRIAMERARDTGTSSMSDVVSTLQDEVNTKNGIFLYYPVYRKRATVDTLDQRRAAIVGYIYSPLSADRLFGQLFPDRSIEFNFTIFDSDDKSPEAVLYQLHPDETEDTYEWVSERTLQLNDQEWTIRYGARNDIIAGTIRDRPQSVAFGGTIFSLIVAMIVYLLLQRRARVIRDKQEHRIERAKDNLLSLASHQLRTPATGVKQYLGMVLEGFTGKIKDEQRDVLSRAYESNERQLRIINEFLYLARADADRVVISPQQFDLLKLIKQIVEDMQTDILEAGHTVRLKYRGKSLNTYADTHSARMILENILSNAVKYTPAGGKIIVTVGIKDSFAKVSVEDNGVGIEKKDFNKLFKQFSRIPNLLTKQTTGTGIGLYLANYLAKLNGGKIDVKSVKDEGSTFTLYLPRKNVRKATVQKNN